LEETRWNVTSLLATSVSWMRKARPVVVSIVLPEPLTSIVPLLDTSRPMPPPAPASMSRPPPEKVRVWPSLPDITTALLTGLPEPAEVVVLMVLDGLLNVVDPPLLPDTTIPPPASLVSTIGPLRVTAPPSRPVISAVWPVPLRRLPG
jgi:hypothetical protein